MYRSMDSRNERFAPLDTSGQPSMHQAERTKKGAITERHCATTDFKAQVLPALANPVRNLPAYIPRHSQRSFEPPVIAGNISGFIEAERAIKIFRRKICRTQLEIDGRDPRN